MLEPYPTEIEHMMQQFYLTLSEKDRRRYAAVEAQKLGHGGVSYIARVLGCDRNTIHVGMKEIAHLPDDEEMSNRIRKSGGGRKPYYETYPNIDEQFLTVLWEHTAGDPMKEDVKWTNLSPGEIRLRLAEQYQVVVSETVIRKLLRKHDYRRRKAKKRTMKHIKHRDEQFENIARLKAKYIAAGNPIISMDTKKKEHLGNFYRDGHLYTQEDILVYDHDFTSFAQGIVIPHGLYDVQRNNAYINLGTSHDTSEFACDSFRNWWYNQGEFDYPGATSILVLCDGGGSNNSHHYIFKQDWQALADEIDIEIRIAHYPPYTSKYNPIEHRLFPHVTRACQGVVFKSIELVRELIEKTRTQHGLCVTVQVIDRVYETSRKAAKDFKETMRIVFDDYLPLWNYTVVPIAEVI